MSSVIQSFTHRGLIQPPIFVAYNLAYEVQVGSYAYGVADEESDNDIYGFCIPYKKMIFPHLAGIIAGFGDQGPKFDQYKQHHVKDEAAGKSYDFCIYGITRYFHLCMEGNPNMIDSLFVPEHCIRHATLVGQMVREKRHLFLSKQAYIKMKAYSYSQCRKLDIKNPEVGSKRDKLVKQFGLDTKLSYHTVRLLDQAEQILTTGTIDLQRDAERLKAIRRGEFNQAQIQEHFESKASYLEKLSQESTLPDKAPEVPIWNLLMECLEQHYGSLSECINVADRYHQAIRDIQKIVGNLN